MMIEIDEAIQKGNYENIHLTRSLETNENKIQSLCLRYVSKKGFPLNPKRERAAYELIREVENICDCMKRICDVLKERKYKVDKECKQFSNNVTKLVSSFYDLYYNMNKASTKLYFEDGKNILNEGYRLLNKGKGSTLLIHHLIDIINRVYFLSHPFFELIN